jgi:hypothetical protein
VFLQFSALCEGQKSERGAPLPATKHCASLEVDGGVGINANDHPMQ